MQIICTAIVSLLQSFHKNPKITAVDQYFILFHLNDDRRINFSRTDEGCY